MNSDTQIPIDDQKYSLIFSDEYLHFDLGEGHPMNPERLKYFKILLESIFPYKNFPFKIYDPVPADPAIIKTVHEEAYIKALLYAEETLEGNIEFGLGVGDCPVFPDVERISRKIVGGTLKAIEHVKKYDGQYSVSFNALGGLHHAWPRKASGFCYYNDCNIAIKHVLNTGKKRILYIDTDCHAGDGVSAYFYRSPEVLTLSIHETGLYLFPGTDFENDIGDSDGAGYSWNLPLLPGTSDVEYLPVVLPLINKAFEFFEPDFVFWQGGVDTYLLDPITHMRLSTNCYQQVAKTIRSLCLQRNLPIVSMGGGGYSPLATSRGWLTQFLTLIGYDPLPTPGKNWIPYCKELLEEFPFCGSLIDQFSFYKQEDSKKILAYNESILKKLYNNLSKFITIH